ncbi:hypothetical protein Tco_1042493 [Tanacetum coccineum]|uniref:Uncharacterized protein n=1 Tax=Tanacetum coccineum TaxID=301880 RepID=A0ABQ5GJV8_9ASTR
MDDDHINHYINPPLKAVSLDPPPSDNSQHELLKDEKTNDDDQHGLLKDEKTNDDDQRLQNSNPGWTRISSSHRFENKDPFGADARHLNASAVAFLTCLLGRFASINRSLIKESVTTLETIDVTLHTPVTCNSNHCAWLFLV